MTKETNIANIPFQAQIRVYTFNCEVVIEQSNQNDNDDVVTVAPENIDQLISALQKAKRQLMGEEH